MIPQTPKHDLLRALHELIRPKSYLEIGVQTGRSLVQARPGTISVGVDPHPQLHLIKEPFLNPYSVHKMTSDEFFATDLVKSYAPYDFVFIDGLHLIEQVLRDLHNSMRWSHQRTIIAVDDVLPYAPEIATREPLPGDWTGDVWKLTSLVCMYTELTVVLVDVAPTGLLLIMAIKPEADPIELDSELRDRTELTHEELDALKSLAETPEDALVVVREFLERTA